MRSASRRTAGLALAALLLVVPFAAADVLVTKDGSRIETKGPWQVKGAQVLFHQPNGTLSSLRVADVDLDASAAATLKANEPPAPEPPPPPRQARIRITEKEIPPVTDRAEETEAAEEGGAPGNEPLAVSAWDQVPISDGAGVEIFGTVRNGGEAIVTAGTVVVSLVDESGGLLATETAELGSVAVPPGRTVDFRIAFPGLADFADVRFAVSSRGYRVLEKAPPAGMPEEGFEEEAIEEGEGEGGEEPYAEGAPPPSL